MFSLNKQTTNVVQRESWDKIADLDTKRITRIIVASISRQFGNESVALRAKGVQKLL